MTIETVTSRVFLTIALGADVNAVVWACACAIYALHRTKCSTMLVHDSTASAAEDFLLDYHRQTTLDRFGFLGTDKIGFMKYGFMRHAHLLFDISVEI